MAFTRRALLEAPVGFRLPMRVPFQHVDAAGIVFFARVLDYFHDAYVAFLDDRGHPLHESIASAPWIAPLVHAEADFLAPLRFGDVVDVAIVAAEVDGSKLTVGYRVEGSPVRAVGHTVHVFVDRDSFRRTAMPAGLEAAFRALG